MGEQEVGATAHGHGAGRPGFATRAIHGAAAPPVAQRPASTPIYQTSTCPGLPADPSHRTGQRILCGGSGGLVAFDLEGGLEAATAFCAALAGRG